MASRPCRGDGGADFTGAEDGDVHGRASFIPRQNSSLAHVVRVMLYVGTSWVGQMHRYILSLMVLLMVMGSAHAQGMLRNRTMLLHDSVQGTQVIFLGPSNKTYLWHRSTDQIVSGRWSTQTSGGLPAICLRYGGTDYNPATGSSGRDPECVNVMTLLEKTSEQVDGDLFGLATRGTAPFQLGTGRTTIRELASRAGVAVTGAVGGSGIMRPGGPLPSREQLCFGLKPEMYARCMDTDADPNTPQ